MRAFRIFLVSVLGSLTIYTLVVGAGNGWNLLPLFFSDIVALTWSGQFNLDFTTFLVLSGLWIAWRHGFSAVGVALGVIGLFGGMMFLAPYLLIASYLAKGDAKVLLLGKARA